MAFFKCITYRNAQSYASEKNLEGHTAKQEGNKSVYDAPFVTWPLPQNQGLNVECCTDRRHLWDHKDASEDTASVWINGTIV